jgi:hypothetical protein
LSNLSDICDALSAQLNSQNATPHWPAKDPDEEM